MPAVPGKRREGLCLWRADTRPLIGPWDGRVGKESEIEENFPLNTRPIVGVTKEIEKKEEFYIFHIGTWQSRPRSCSEVTRLGGASLGAAVVPR